MEHYKSGQYDDDLTVGIDDYDESFEAGDIDLFDYVGDDDSPLARLKSIILSIDWEITDDILRQFNEELRELKEYWAGEKINLIYVQALEKISRYIYKEKSSAHPNAIKLLLTFYTNLEKVVSDDTITDRETKQILREDIERFEKLKKQISPKPSDGKAPVSPAAEERPIIAEASVQQPEAAVGSAIDHQEETTAPDDSLLNLKAIVYGIDWEITEKDLKNLSSEVKLLEEKFKGSKAKKIFLQGIGSLGAYINLKRSDAHADAFKLLHSFFVGLETVVRDNLTGQAEKDILLPQVEKFNVFKAAIAETMTPETVQAAATEEQADEFDESEIQPAFADVPEDVHGFQDDDAAATVEPDYKKEDSIDEFFEEDEIEEYQNEGDKALTSEMESRLAGMFDEPGEEAAKGLAPDIALQGVDVETEADDDSDEDPLPEEDGELAPALAAEEPVMDEEESPAVFAEKEDDLVDEPVASEDTVLGGAIPGVDVEHEADDDTGEAPLPFEDGEYAPALAGDQVKDDADQPIAKTEIDDKLDDFFGEPEDTEEIQEEEQSFTAETDEIEPETEEIAAEVDESIAGFLDEVDEDITADSDAAQDVGETSTTEDIDERMTDFFGDDSAEVPLESDDRALQGVDVETEDDDDSEEDPLPEEDGELAPAFSGEESLSEDESEDVVAEVDHEGDQVAFTSEESEEVEIEPDEDVVFDSFADDEDEELDLDVLEDEATSAVDEKFDEMFAVESDEVPEDQLSEQFFSSDEEQTSEFFSDDAPLSETTGEDEFLQGVDVEHEDDDDSEEAPLPLEDEDFAPAFATDPEEELGIDPLAESEVEEDAVGAAFDDVFGDDSPAESADTDTVDSFVADHAEEPSEEPDAEAVDAGVSVDGDTAFVAAGFEEIEDEEIEDFPEEAFADTAEDIRKKEETEELAAALEATESGEDEILALLGDEDHDTSPVAGLGSAAVHSDEDIAEMSADELATVLSGPEDVAAAGDIPTGYPSEDELLGGFGEVAGSAPSVEAVTHPEGNTDFIVGIEGLDEAEDDEEVVFEPVAESDELDTIAEEYHDEGASDYELEEDSFGTTLLPNDEELRTEANFGETADEPPEAVEQPFTQESAYVTAEGGDVADDKLAELRNCIVSLGLEIDGQIISSLNAEIEKLRHAWMNKPAEKTFIQLLSTVTGHIEKYGYDSDPEANKLLLSVFDKLELCSLGTGEDAQIQEAILNETSKILQWQTHLIDRSSLSGNGGTSSMLGKQDMGELKSSAVAALSVAADEPTAPVAEELEKKQIVENVSAIMRSEIDQLIQAFQTEIQGLKDEIRQVKGKD